MSVIDQFTPPVLSLTLTIFSGELRFLWSVIVTSEGTIFVPSSFLNHVPTIYYEYIRIDIFLIIKKLFHF